jgi:hypothetical protein
MKGMLLHPDDLEICPQTGDVRNFAPLTVGSPFCVTEMVNEDRRHLFHPQHQGSSDSGVPGDDFAVARDQHSSDETVLVDAPGNLLELLLRVRSRVPAIGLERSRVLMKISNGFMSTSCLCWRSEYPTGSCPAVSGASRREIIYPV